ncbi:hypothetical protein D6779_05570 [Candidatus Parcubacteria bacterium]|nr:MAG: hypothetical protein D6779_05570 [Candidatus Parcubacteria bacterium]
MTVFDWMELLGSPELLETRGAACSCCERMFTTHQERLPKEPAAAGIASMGGGELLSGRVLHASVQ